MNILIFDDKITGHHIEYLHHLYVSATKRKKTTFYFLVSEAFNKAKGNLQWEKSDNVIFLYLTNKEEILCSQSNLLRAAWNRSIVVRNRVQRYSIDKVWLIVFMSVMPFLPFLLHREVKISGILYRIFLYDIPKYSKVRLLKEHILFYIITRCLNVERIFILNDKLSTEKLNNLFHTIKFIYLPDPIPQIDDSKVRNIRSELTVNEGNTLFLHFGSMDRRKGTLCILQAIKYLSNQELSKMTFIFAGKINETIKDDFYNEYNMLRDRADIRIYDEFCSYDFLNNLCYSCDCILIPYENTSQSSGVIGYAAHFRKPVIGPQEGLLGRLIVSYSMGLVLSKIDGYNLAQAMRMGRPCIKESYVEKHRISSFSKLFF